VKVTAEPRRRTAMGWNIFDFYLIVHELGRDVSSPLTVDRRGEGVERKGACQNVSLRTGQPCRLRGRQDAAVSSHADTILCGDFESLKSGKQPRD